MFAGCWQIMPAHFHLFRVEGAGYWQLIRAGNRDVCRSCDLYLQVATIKEGTVNFASLESSKMISTANGKPLEDQYRSLLNKHNVHFISAEKLKIIYKRATSVEPTFSKMAPLKDAVFSDISKKNSQISKTDVNKAFSIFLRLDLISTEMPGSRDEIIKVKKLKAKDFILEVDRFLISMLSGLCRTNNVELKAKELKKLTLSSISKKDIEEIINV
jgi:hypothetical protein